MKKAKLLFDEMETEGKPECFEASRGWLDRLMKRNGLPFRRRTSIAQKDPAQLINKLVTYILQVRRLQIALPPLTFMQWMRRRYGLIWWE